MGGSHIVKGAVFLLFAFVGYQSTQMYFNYVNTEQAQQACLKGYLQATRNSSHHSKNFGEKVCACAVQHVQTEMKKFEDMTSDERVEMTQTCVSATLLSSAAKPYRGKEDVHEKRLVRSCQFQFSLIAGGHLTEEAKEISDSFCSCASSSLMEAVASETDEGFHEAINAGAAKCKISFGDNDDSDDEENG